MILKTLGYVCQYFTKDFKGPVTNLMSELSKSLDVTNYSSARKHMQYYSSGSHESSEERVTDTLTLKRYRERFRIHGLVFPKDLARMLSQDRPDVVQSEEYYQPATRLASDYCVKTGTPFVINHRASEPRTRTLAERAFFALANPVSKKVADSAAAFVCLSAAGKKSLLSVYPALEEKVHIIPNAIDPTGYGGADPAGFREQHSIPSDADLLVCVARLHPQKRIDLLVKAFAKVKRQNKKAVLAVVGPSFEAEMENVKAVIDEEKAEDVVFTGPLPNERVKDAYAAADVCAMTSEYEPFGYSLLEAMVQKKPQVAFDIGCVAEIIGEAGAVVPFADVAAFAEHVQNLFSDEALRKSLGQKAYAQVEKKYDIRRTSKDMIKLYGSL